MVVYINQNLILNSDNVCYAKIVADEEKGFTNKMQIALVGGENIEVDFSSVEVCKALFILTLTKATKKQDSFTRVFTWLSECY